MHARIFDKNDTEAIILQESKILLKIKVLAFWRLRNYNLSIFIVQYSFLIREDLQHQWMNNLRILK